MGARAYLAAMAAAALLPVLLVAGFVLNTLLDAQRAAVTQSVLESARAISLAMDQELATAETVLRVLASSAYLSKRDLASFQQQASAARADEGMFIALYDERGNALIDTGAQFGASLPARADHERLG